MASPGYRVRSCWGHCGHLLTDTAHEAVSPTKARSCSDMTEAAQVWRGSRFRTRRPPQGRGHTTGRGHADRAGPQGGGGATRRGGATQAGQAWSLGEQSAGDGTQEGAREGQAAWGWAPLCPRHGQGMSRDDPATTSGAQAPRGPLARAAGPCDPAASARRAESPCEQQGMGPRLAPATTGEQSGSAVWSRSQHLTGVGLGPSTPGFRWCRIPGSLCQLGPCLGPASICSFPPPAVGSSGLARAHCTSPGWPGGGGCQPSVGKWGRLVYQKLLRGMGEEEHF